MRPERAKIRKFASAGVLPDRMEDRNRDHKGNLKAILIHCVVFQPSQSTGRRCAYVFRVRLLIGRFWMMVDTGRARIYAA